MKDIRELKKEEQIKIIFKEGKTEIFNLRGADLRGADLRWAYLSGAKGKFIFNWGVKLEVVKDD
jgi:hypothetical protein